MRMKRYFYTCILLVITVPLFMETGVVAESKKPNIVIIWGDDIGQTNIIIIF